MPIMLMLKSNARYAERFLKNKSGPEPQRKNYLSGSIYVLGGGGNLKVTMMDAALKYAEANIPVIPLHWICEGGL